MKNLLKILCLILLFVAGIIYLTVRLIDNKPFFSPQTALILGIAVIILWLISINDPLPGGDLIVSMERHPEGRRITFTIFTTREGPAIFCIKDMNGKTITAGCEYLMDQANREISFSLPLDFEGTFTVRSYGLYGWIWLALRMKHCLETTIEIKPIR